MDEVENPFQMVLRDLEINGVLIDRDKLEVFKDDCRQRLFDLECDMLHIFGRQHDVQTNLFGEKIYTSPINFGSTPQLVSLSESLGFPITERPKTKNSPGGQPSVNAKTKQRLKEKHPFFKLLWRHGKLTKLYNSFLLPCANFIDPDGRVRPSYQMVRTGRLSCSEPNLQQLPNPKKGNLEFNFREIVIPKPGNVIVRGDWSGQELRVLAEVSKDDNMVAAFNKNYDLHSVC
jgi:DNA polymerase-1